MGIILNLRLIGLSQSDQVFVNIQEVSSTITIPVTTVSISPAVLYFFFSSRTFSLMLSH